MKMWYQRVLLFAVPVFDLLKRRDFTAIFSKKFTNHLLTITVESCYDVTEHTGK